MLGDPDAHLTQVLLQIQLGPYICTVKHRILNCIYIPFGRTNSIFSGSLNAYICTSTALAFVLHG